MVASSMWDISFDVARPKALAYAIRVDIYNNGYYHFPTTGDELPAPYTIHFGQKSGKQHVLASS